MKVTQDIQSDSVYIEFSNKGISHSREITEDIALDVAADGSTVGIDIQNWTALQQESQQANGSLLTVQTTT